MGVYRLFYSVDDLWMSVKNGISFVISMLMPFIIAIVVAYMLKPVRNAFTWLLRRIFPKVRQEVNKGWALFITMVLFLAMVGTGIGFLIPAIVKNVFDLVSQLPFYFTVVRDWIIRLQSEVTWLSWFDMQTVEQQVLGWVQNLITSSNWSQLAGQIASQVAVAVGGVLSGLLTFIMSMVMCVYILKSGSLLADNVKGVLINQLGEKRAGGIISFFRDTDQVFGQYIGSKMIQSLIMFSLVLPLFMLLGVTYSPLMAAIMAVTNLIPYVGPFIGGAIPVFFMLLINPLKALLVLLVVVLVQQIDNYLVEPRLIGDRMGMHPFWVITCVIIGGNLFGLFGVLLAVPIAGVIRVSANRYYEAKRRARKQQEDKSERDDI
jgi:predicted PurR-regulated permease PerM